MSEPANRGSFADHPRDEVEPPVAVLATDATIRTELIGDVSNGTLAVVSTFLTIAGLLVMVEKFYVRPTRGRGIQALLAVIQAGERCS